MAINLNALNAQQEKKAAEAKAARYKDPYLVYELKMNNKEKFEAVFTSADSKGNLFFRDTEYNIDLCLPIEALQASDKYYNVLLRANYIGIKTLEVMVDHIDRENRMVYLKSGRMNDNTAKQIMFQLDRFNKNRWEWTDTNKKLKPLGKSLDNEETLKEVNADREKKGLFALTKPEPQYVYGTIVALDGDRRHAYVKIFDLNIQGIISRENWTSDFIKYFPDSFVDEYPDPIKFELIGVYRDPVTRRKFYKLSTKRLESNAWTNMPPALAEKEAQVLAMCTAIDDKCWWAQVDGCPVPLYGLFNEKYEIRIGHTYFCKVRKSDIENHSIVLMPYKYLQKKGQTQIRGVSDAGDVITAEEADRLIKARSNDETKNIEAMIVKSRKPVVNNEEE